MKRGFVILLLFILIGSITAASEYFGVGEPSHLIDKAYGPSDYIRGWINISLSDAPADLLFVDSEENSMMLIDLLKLNEEDFSYSCSTQGCISDYSASNPEETKIFNLNIGDPIVFGFKLQGDITKIDSVNFTIESDSQSSCYNQLKIDFGNDGEIDIINDKILNAVCFSKNYGCFDINKESGEGTIGSTPYCQRIKLDEFPGFRLGAWVKNVSGSGDLKMELYDGGTWVAGCDLPEPSAEWSEIHCDVDYPVNELKDYYVCISDPEEGTYKIKGYSDPENKCGFLGQPIKIETSSYNISAQGKRFDDVGTLGISNPQDFGTLAEDYIENKYGSLDCSDECIFPIEFIPKGDQEITIKNLLIKYDIVGLTGNEENDFYNLTESAAKVNASFQKLYLDHGNFSVPSSIDNHTFWLKLGGEEIFEEEISVVKMPVIKFLTPTTTAAGVPTEFEAKVDLPENITQYKWDFGNNDTKTTTTNKVTYTYDAIDSYEMKITITDSNQRTSSKIFDIDVGSPKEVVNDMLAKMLKDLDNVKTQIENFDSFYQEGLNSVLDIALFDDELEKIQVASASPDADWIGMMDDILKLKIPESIITSMGAESILFYPERININLDILEMISGEEYDTGKESEYIDAIFSWNQENMDTKISFDELSAKYENFEEPILNIFKLRIKKKKDLNYNSYLVLQEFDEIRFKEDYSEEKESGYIYIDLKENESEIEFSTTEDISFDDLPVFISPKINRLAITLPSTKEKISKWVFLILILLLLFIVGFIGYLILQIWYKKKYESHLFKNRNDLYNLITYIQNAKKKGLKNKDIYSRLKKSGWNSEQVRYVTRKYIGKRTGMLEIPVEKVLKRFKKKNIPQNKPKRFLAHSSLNHMRGKNLGGNRLGQNESKISTNPNLSKNSTEKKNHRRIFFRK